MLHNGRVLLVPVNNNLDRIGFIVLASKPTYNPLTLAPLPHHAGDLDGGRWQADAHWSERAEDRQGQGDCQV